MEKYWLNIFKVTKVTTNRTKKPEYLPNCQKAINKTRPHRSTKSENTKYDS